MDLVMKFSDRIYVVDFGKLISEGTPAEVQADPRVLEAVRKVTEALGDSGRILVRASGTEPLVRVMVEADSEEICRKYVSEVCAVIREAGYAV